MGRAGQVFRTRQSKQVRAKQLQVIDRRINVSIPRSVGSDKQLKAPGQLFLSLVMKQSTAHGRQQRMSIKARPSFVSP